MIGAVLDVVRTHLQHAVGDVGLTDADVALVDAAELAGRPPFEAGAGVALFPYRLEPDPAAFNFAAPSADGSLRRNASEIRLNVHFLVVARGRKAGGRAPIEVLAWAYRRLAGLPVIGAAALSDPDAVGWRRNESVQLSAESLALDVQLRVFEALGSKFSPCAAFVVRSVRVDLESDRDGPSVASREIGKGARGSS